MSKSLSYIHPDAKIGKNVVIDSFVTIDKDVIIGEGTWIGPNATIMAGARIGNNCKIFPGAVISAPPQDLKFSGEYSTVEIGNNTTIREFVTINRGTVSKEKTVIGDNTLLMAYVHIAHDCIIGNHCIIVNSVNVAGEVEIGDWAIIGGTSAIHQFVKIGAHVMISGGSLVRKDVPPFIMAGKDPLCYAGINSIGLRRRKFSNDIIYQIQDIYREIYQKNQNNTQAIEKINKNFPQSSERDEIVNFIKNSERGIIRG
ncbi:MAG: acyl-ACP--UDP-N-acetylglucosamine O-acyltransferase [Bacteroidales bacterium]|jgi:UDP-N-acetylglucosamine acyltransferase|nr:acyl-ACP--UDP-N-acetylglucosamine O-acyltransferase [Bacteroidales bacterium]